jgi:beta-lactamase superfamily II metal-dependent hydrolase
MFNGLEVDMLSVGNADCLVVTQWANNVPTNVLIDGGNKTDIGSLRPFLKRRGITYLHALVCTHPHDDHAAGLLELLKDESVGIGRAYFHIPQLHVNQADVEKALRLAGSSAEADSIRKTLATATDLVAACKARKIRISQPFAGMAVEFLTVAGPSLQFYQELLSEFADADSIRAVDTQQGMYKIWSALHDHALETLDTELPPNPQTTPENNSCVILGCIQDNQKYLFTSDAGVRALEKASEAYNLTGCHWMQIPHHGSRRNINPALIKVFSPTFAWASAEGSTKHPRRAVVNAFKDAGAVVCSTHYPIPTNMWIKTGTVPARVGYENLVPLYDASLSKIPSPPASPWRSVLLNAK